MSTPVQWPQPDGEYKVGLSYMNFVDQTRRVVFPKHDNHFRDIPVMIWYPAKYTEGFRPRPYASREEFQAEVNGLVSVFPELGDRIKSQLQYQEIPTYSFINTPPIDLNALPTIFFVHGYTWLMWQNQTQFEHLASHGYVVIAFGIPQEGILCYPDGRIEITDHHVYKTFLHERNAEAQVLKKCWGILGQRKNKNYQEIREASQILYDPKIEPFLKNRMEGWYQDFLFVLQEIEELNRSGKESRFHGKLNLEKIGFFGMSFGGGLASMIAYKKVPVNVSGTISLDGSHYGLPYDAKIESPHMIVQSNEESRMLFEMTDKDSCYITVPDSLHFNFCDSPLVNWDVWRSLGLVGGIDPYQQVHILNTCSLTFFDHYVRGLPNRIKEELGRLPGIEVEVK